MEKETFDEVVTSILFVFMLLCILLCMWLVEPEPEAEREFALRTLLV